MIRFTYLSTCFRNLSPLATSLHNTQIKCIYSRGNHILKQIQYRTSKKIVTVNISRLAKNTAITNLKSWSDEFNFYLCNQRFLNSQLSCPQFPRQILNHLSTNVTNRRYFYAYCLQYKIKSILNSFISLRKRIIKFVFSLGNAVSIVATSGLAISGLGSKYLNNVFVIKRGKLKITISVKTP